MHEISHPKASARSKSGRAGPRKGKPQGRCQTGSDSPFAQLRGRKIKVQMDGIERELTLAEALLYKTLQQALAGKRMAIREILKRIQAHEKGNEPARRTLVTFLVKQDRPQSVDRAMLALGIAAEVPGMSQSHGGPQLVLEPWAVARGLARGKGRQLSNKDIRALKSQTRDPDSVAWPQGPDHE
ncbi:DUF5681 domain-containing protein [Sphingomonas mesophila]|uniref:DUF5681 domain-containing protein n=1 Tax=Sphingomonas mesophila TaxID=2303576 RepID=UPI001F081978|nr:DUF5681 domain-containing protein [Sphingomonas mesophila]